MPAGVVRPGQEAQWEAAKRAVRKQYPGKKGASFWRLVNAVFGRMTHRKAAAALPLEITEDVRRFFRGLIGFGQGTIPESAIYPETMADDGKGGYLVTDKDGGHLPTRKNGKLDHGLMGGAWAALHGGYRGNKYSGPGKSEAIAKLKKLYKSEGMTPPGEKAAASAEDQAVATCAIAIATADATDWIELIPAGKFSAVDGRGPFDNQDPSAIIAASIAKMPEVGLVVDYDHSTDLAAPEGRQSPAAGWIKEFKVDNDAIFVRIEWTQRGAEALTAKEYRYISPVFEHGKDGTVERILRAALTNNPALINLPAIAAAEVSRMAKGKPKLSEVLAGLEAMSPSSTHGALIHAAHALCGEGKSFQDWAEEEQAEHHMDDGSGDDDGNGDEHGGNYDPAASTYEATPMAGDDPYMSESADQMAARQADEMAKCATDDEKANCTAKHAAEKERFAKRQEEMAKAPQPVATSTAIATAAAIPPKPKKKQEPEMTQKEIEAAIAKHPAVVQMATELNTMRVQRQKDEAIRKVDSAIREGRLIPAHRDWGIQYCTADSAGFDTFLTSQPKIIQSGADGTFTARIGEPPTGPSSLSVKEIDIFANLGLTTDEQLAKCAAVKTKWDLQFPRPRRFLDDNSVIGGKDVAEQIQR